MKITSTVSLREKYFDPEKSTSLSKLMDETLEKCFRQQKFFKNKIKITLSAIHMLYMIRY